MANTTDLKSAIIAAGVKRKIIEEGAPATDETLLSIVACLCMGPKLSAPQASQPIGQPLPMAIGVSRDMESPGAKSVLVAFERQLTDDELRTLHSSLSNSQPVSGAMTDEAWSNVHGASAESILASIMFRANRAKDKGELFAQVELDQIATLAKEGLALLKQERDEIRDHILTGVKGQVQQMMKAQEELLSASGQAVSEKAVITACLRACNSVDPQYSPDRANAITECMAAIRALSFTPAQQTEAPVNVPSGYVLVPVERIQKALDVVQNTMEDAYRNAYQECCGRASGECCGNPDAAWSKEDQRIMDALAPAQRELSSLLAAAPAPAQAEAQQSDVSAQLRTLSEQAEERRQVEKNQYLERIHLGMRDAYGHAAQIVDAAQTQSEKDAERYRWMRDWFIRGGKRSEIHPMGHIQTTTPEIVDANIDAAIAKEKAK